MRRLAMEVPVTGQVSSMVSSFCKRRWSGSLPHGDAVYVAILVEPANGQVAGEPSNPSVAHFVVTQSQVLRDTQHWLCCVSGYTDRSIFRNGCRS
jgi:hypothetical protein